MHPGIETLIETMISNALVGTALAILAFAATRAFRNPPLAHLLWLLVLVKLVTPPVIPIRVIESRGLDHLIAESLLRPESAQPRADGELRATGGEWGTPAGESQATAPSVRSVSSVDENGRAELLAGGLPGVESVSSARIPLEPIAAVGERQVPESGRTPGPRPLSWLGPALLTLWLAGSVAWFLLAAVRTITFDRLLRRARSAAPGLSDLARELSARMGIRRAPEVVVVTASVPPLVWTLGRRARIVLPAGLIERLSREQQAELLVHELAHLRRRDSCVRWLELVVLGVYWWLPTAWWARRQLQEAEEHCCDAWVQWMFPDANREYARALMLTVDFLSDGRFALPQAASGLGRTYLLKRRFRMILEGRGRRRLSVWTRVALSAVGLTVLPLTPQVLTGQTGGAQSLSESVAESGGIPDAGVDDAFDIAPAPGKGGDSGSFALLVPQNEPGVSGDPLATAEDSDDLDSAVDRRLEALEKQVARMMAELQALRRDRAVTKRRVTRPRSSKRTETEWRQWGQKSAAPRPDAESGDKVILEQDGKVLTLDPAKGTITATDKRTNKKLWVTKTGKDQFVEEGRFVIETDDGSRYRVEPESGRIVKWVEVIEKKTQPRRDHVEALRRIAAQLEAEKAKLLDRLEQIEAKQATIQLDLKRITQEDTDTPRSSN